MEDNLSFLDLDNNGEVLYIYCDKNNIHLVYLDQEENKLYRFALDKFYYIELVSEVKGDISKYDFTDSVWHLPSQANDGTYIFKGLVKNKETKVYEYFKINDFDVLSFTQANYDPSEKEPRVFIKDVNVDHVIKKGNRTYIVGLSKKYNEQLFGILDNDSNEIIRKYYLNSDKGDLTCNTISVDFKEKRVYVGGAIREFDVDDNFVKSSPYLDSFILV